MIIADKRHDGRELILRQQGLYLLMMLAAIPTGHVIQRAAAYEVFDDIFADLLRIFRDDTYPLAAVERSREIVYRHSVNHRADDTDDDHTEVVDKERRATDDNKWDLWYTRPSA